MDFSFRGLFACALWLTLPPRLFAAETLSGDTTSPAAGSYNIGNTSNGSMTVDGGTIISGKAIKLALGDGAEGTLTISGEGTSVTTTTGLTVGVGTPAGTDPDTKGIVNIINGGLLTSGTTRFNYIGLNPEATGIINVTGSSNGTASTYNARTGLYIGSSGSGAVNVTAGGRFTYASIGMSAGIHIGASSTGTGTVLVDGAGSVYSGTGGMSIGAAGTGNVTVSNGGSFTHAVTGTSTSSTISIGAQFGTGTVTVDGIGSTLAISGLVALGGYGNGSLTISNGATATGIFNTATLNVPLQGVFYAGENASSSGTIHVTGAGSTWSTIGTIYLGYKGNGVLNITAGGTVNTALNNNPAGNGIDYQTLYIGAEPGSTGSVLVDGPGSQWNITNITEIGGIVISGSGVGSSSTIIVQNGGKANLRDLFAHNNTTITIKGANSVMSTGRVVLGNTFTSTDSATISVKEGGVLNSLSAYVGSRGTGISTVSKVSVDGSGSQWNVTGTLTAGLSSGTGLITLARGGTLSIYSDAAHRLAGIGDGTFLLGDAPSNSDLGTPLSVGVLYIGTGAEPGVLNAASVGGYLNGSVTSDSTVIFNHNQKDYSFTNTGTSGGAGVTITGSTVVRTVAGTTILTANSTNQGATAVTGGKLIVNNPGGTGTSGTGRGSIIVDSGGTLGGTGRITPATSAGAIQVSGTLAPGSVSSSGESTIGTFTIDSGSSSAAHILTLDSGAALQFDLGAGLSSDRIVLLNGSAADIFFYGNVIYFTDLTDGHLDAGNYALFTASSLANYGGLTTDSDNTITSGLSLGTGLENYQASLALSGNDIVLRIASVPEPSSFLLVVLGCLGLWRRRISRVASRPASV